ncbi:MAG: DUF2867 domain-containing protein, partial [Undibacterium sp.]|nr:DUF2867 domain-containing protein [Undibacterium sp.]
LLAVDAEHYFAEKFPVLAHQTSPNFEYAQVILGANDKHLRFRSCVEVRVTSNGIYFGLGTKVQCKNLFGRLYMCLIEKAHSRYVTPHLLNTAVRALNL